nr:ATP synthase F0 subunit 8 [Brachyponera chinensis]
MPQMMPMMWMYMFFFTFSILIMIINLIYFLTNNSTQNFLNLSLLKYSPQIKWFWKW